MANIQKSTKRENNQRKARQGMRISNRSIFQIQEAIIKRANASKNRRNSRHYHITSREI